MRGKWKKQANKTEQVQFNYIEKKKREARDLTYEGTRKVGGENCPWFGEEIYGGEKA